MYLLFTRNTKVFCLICLACMFTDSNASFESCKSNSDCAKGYCCAGLRTIRYCMRNKQLGELCSNTYVKGQTMRCGCEQDLTCAIVKRDMFTGSTQHRCVEIPPEAKERQDKNNSTSTMTKLLTSIELRRLLKLMEEKPKLKIKP